GWITERVIVRLHPHHLLPTIVFSSGLLSAFLVNDVVCLVMTPFAIHLARRLRLSVVPYAIAVATASNIGSVATITGNPQNMLIGSLSGIPYVKFAAALAPVALAGLFVNWGLLYWIGLRGGSDAVPVRVALAGPEFQHQRIRAKPVIVLVAVLVGFVAGVPAALTAASGAALLLVSRSVDPRKVYDEVD